MNKKIHFITAKQNLATAAVTHAEQICQHANSKTEVGRLPYTPET